MSPAAGSPGPGRSLARGSRFGRLGVAALAALALSCASSSELARRSDESLKAGHTMRAYDWARKALDKDPKNDEARAHMIEAASLLSMDWKRRIRSLAATDSLTAAEQALDYARFRAELARYNVVLGLDSAFRADERRIRDAAAAQNYRAAESFLEQRQPKAAYLSFVEAARFVPGYGDLEQRIPETYERALTRVAVLPFANQTEVPGLSKEIADGTFEALENRMTPNRFQFTRLVAADQTYRRVSVGELDRMDRDVAVRIGRQLGAKLVVWGRYSGLNARSDTQRYHETIFRKVLDPDIHAKPRERYEQHEFLAVTREREVSVRCEFEVLDTDSETPVARHDEVVRAVANTVYSEFQASGDCDDYCLVTPALKEKDRSRAEQLDKQWEQTFGHWTLPKLLEKARDSRGRREYQPSYRDEFRSSSYIFPVFLDDLPSASDLAFLALDDTWKPLFDALRGLDGQDLAPATTSGAVER